MPVIRWIKRLDEGVYEFWYDDNTKKVERVDPKTKATFRRLAEKWSSDGIYTPQ